MSSLTSLIVDLVNKEVCATYRAAAELVEQMTRNEPLDVLPEACDAAITALRSRAQPPA